MLLNKEEFTITNHFYGENIRNYYVDHKKNNNIIQHV